MVAQPSTNTRGGPTWRPTSTAAAFSPVFGAAAFFGAGRRVGALCQNSSQPRLPSATAIRALIKQLIGAENPRSPLTDSRIAEVLGEQGILVARRTIAKYREALQIPPVNMRKTP